MHPSHDILRQYVGGRLDNGVRANEISAHIEKCEFCREYCREYAILKEISIGDEITEMPAKAKEMADKLFNDSITGQIIELKPFERETVSKFILAADGETEIKPDVENVATLYSDNPELILRHMRDNKTDSEYLQLIGDEKYMFAQVLVCIPEINEEFMTDQNGRVYLEKRLAKNVSEMKWQVKMPDAMFTLKPYKYDPDAVEYKKELELETEKNDKIKVTFMGLAGGKQISIKILKLDGREDFGDIKVSIAHRAVSEIKSIAPNKIITFDLAEVDDEINIRLFRV